MDEKKKISNSTVYFILFVVAIVFIVLFIFENNSNNSNDYAYTSTNSYNDVDSGYYQTPTAQKKEVTVVDFSTMTKDEIKNWCNENKIDVRITEEYSNDIAKGNFISQSASANSTVYEGSRITVVYSLGKEPTLGEKNALKKADSYLRSLAFSYTGLIGQLEYSGFTHEEATYAADNCGADWNEQAAKKAKSYMNSLSLSRKGLIEQLEYTGFTKEQAEYGAKSVGY